jgi:hypothetical protein
MSESRRRTVVVAVLFLMRARMCASIVICWLALRCLAIGNALAAIAQRVEPDL